MGYPSRFRIDVVFRCLVFGEENVTEAFGEGNIRLSPPVNVTDLPLAHGNDGGVETSLLDDSRSGFELCLWFECKQSPFPASGKTDSTMIGLTLGKKALKFGYKRAGIPGAIATGSAAAVGYALVKRSLRSSTDSENVDGAINTQTIKSAVNEDGLSAVTDRDTLESAIDEDELETNVDVGDVQSQAEEKSNDLDQDSDTDSA